MAQVIKPHEVRVITKDGEIQVSLTIDLNINLDGTVKNVSAQSIKETKEAVKEEEKTEFIIPDFTNSPKIQFGKKV